MQPPHDPINLHWSEEDGEWVANSPAWPALSALAESPGAAGDQLEEAIKLASSANTEAVCPVPESLTVSAETRRKRSQNREARHPCRAFRPNAVQQDPAWWRPDARRSRGNSTCTGGCSADSVEMREIKDLPICHSVFLLVIMSRHRLRIIARPRHLLHFRTTSPSDDQ